MLPMLAICTKYPGCHNGRPEAFTRFGRLGNMGSKREFRTVRNRGDTRSTTRRSLGNRARPFDRSTSPFTTASRSSSCLPILLTTNPHIVHSMVGIPLFLFSFYSSFGTTSLHSVSLPNFTNFASRSQLTQHTLTYSFHIIRPRVRSLC
jgi:hypothetical protein